MSTPESTSPCTVCGAVKPLEDFYADRSSSNGRRSACKACEAVKGKAYRLANPQKCQAWEKRRWSDSERRASGRIRGKRWKNKVKLAAMERYGGAKCNCCGETGIAFLTLDHIAGDGAAHRKQIGGKGRRMAVWLKNNGYPPGFQVLCFNCNIASYQNNGICPHKHRS